MQLEQWKYALPDGTRFPTAVYLHSTPPIAFPYVWVVLAGSVVRIITKSYSSRINMDSTLIFAHVRCRAPGFQQIRGPLNQYVSHKLLGYRAAYCTNPAASFGSMMKGMMRIGKCFNLQGPRLEHPAPDGDKVPAGTQATSEDGAWTEIKGGSEGEVENEGEGHLNCPKEGR
ncbi:hypothetical protein K438DRAFT_1754133 [Mycena galopus ATCC 62051]|nr:hypothetical protein K438DRAFT_1754133 [Mycena galopus ATCC 62051]